MLSDSHKPTSSDPDAANPHRQRWVAAGVTLIVLICAFAGQGVRGLWEPDEGRYTAVPLEMLRSGDWLHPALNDTTPHYSKPPLTYWLIAASIKAFGRNETAARLPNGAAFALTALLAGLIASRVAPGRAHAATVIYATSAFAFIASGIVTTDTLLTLCTAGAGAGFVLAWRRFDTPGEPGGRGFHAWPLRGMWIALGLAFMTKGPPGLLVLLPIVAVVGCYDGIKNLWRLLDPLGVVLFLVIGLTWYLVVVAQNPQLLGYFLGDELYGRVFTNMHGRNSQWYHALTYLPLLAGGMLPWSVDWLRARARQAFRGIRQDPAKMFLLLWVALPLIVFMLSSSRLPLYVLPLMVPLAVAGSRLQRDGWLNGRGAWWNLALIVIVMVGIRIGVGLMPHQKDDGRLMARITVPQEVREIVYVQGLARYGLSLYTGVPVKLVSLENQGDEPTLVQELERAPASCLMLAVRADDLDTVRRQVQQEGWRIASQQTALGRAFVRIDR